MRLLVVSQHYWPEPFNVSDMCEGLACRGHKVIVLTGLPNYPEGSVYQGYEHGHNRRQDRNGVCIVRSSLIPRKSGVLYRAANYYSFRNSATKVAKALDSDFDVVMSFQTSPVMMAEPAIAYAEKNDTPLLHYVVDIWPECLLSGGIKKDSAIYRYYAKVSKRIYAKADRLAVTSPLFKDYLESLLGVPVSTTLLPQYAEDLFSQQPTQVSKGYQGNKLNLTFAGNIGAAQSVDTIVQAAKYLKDDDGFIFHLVGSGSEKQKCEHLANKFKLPNMMFHDRRPLDEMPTYYAASDAMLATFADDPVLGYTLPRKIQSYMAAGKPILGALSGEARRVVEESGCGLCCDAEDGKGFANICREFAEMSKSARNDMGVKGRDYYEKHFSKEIFFETLERELEDLKGMKHGR